MYLATFKMHHDILDQTLRLIIFLNKTALLGIFVIKLKIKQ